MKPWRPWENSAKFSGASSTREKGQRFPKLQQPGRNKGTLIKTQKTASYYEFKASSIFKAYLTKTPKTASYHEFKASSTFKAYLLKKRLGWLLPLSFGTKK